VTRDGKPVSLSSLEYRALRYLLHNKGRPVSDPRYQRPAGGAYWRIDEGGHAALRSVSLWDFDFTPAPRAHLSPTGLASERHGPNSSTVYLAEREVVLDGAGGPHSLRIAVALDTSAVERLRRSFGGQVIMALGVIAAVLSAGTWIQSSFALRPLANIRDQLARIHRGADSRMKARYPSEIARLVDGLNKLIGQHEELVRRARERAGDLAHGLKTPLTIMRIEARNAEARGDVRLATARLIRGRPSSPHSDSGPAVRTPTSRRVSLPPREETLPG
jgi:signal transduction histidine kinase